MTIEERADLIYPSGCEHIGSQHDAYLEGAEAAIELVEKYIKERVLWIAMVPHIFSSACYTVHSEEFLNELLNEIKGK